MSLGIAGSSVEDSGGRAQSWVSAAGGLLAEPGLVLGWPADSGRPPTTLCSHVEVAGSELLSLWQLRARVEGRLLFLNPHWC